VNLLVGDSSPARKELGWVPRISFDMMVKKMVEYDIELLNEEEAKQVPNVNQQVLKISK
jgi:GDPmannose 4,6-dehydratase